MSNICSEATVASNFFHFHLRDNMPVDELLKSFEISFHVLEKAVSWYYRSLSLLMEEANILEEFFLNEDFDEIVNHREKAELEKFMRPARMV